MANDPWNVGSQSSKATANNIGLVTEAIHHVADNALMFGVPLEKIPPLIEKRNEDIDYALTRFITLGERLVNIISSGLDITVTTVQPSYGGEETKIQVRWVVRRGE